MIGNQTAGRRREPPRIIIFSSMTLSLKRLILFLVPVCLVAAGVVLASLPYRPPLLDRGGRNLKERLLDHALFVWHYTRAAWREGIEIKPAALADRARAVWHHPALSERFFGIPATDFRQLARLYESLGLFEEAAALIEHSFELGDTSPPEAQAALLTCAGLSAWETVERIAGRALAPDFPEAGYWLGRALIEQGRFNQAAADLVQVETSRPGFADLYFQMGRAARGRGNKAAAENYYRQAVERSPSHQEAWKALAGICREGDREQEEAAAAAAALLPPLSAGGRFENELVFLGSSYIPSPIRGGEKFDLTLYLRALPGEEREVFPLLRLQGPRSAKAVPLGAVSLPSSPGEEYLAVPTTAAVPEDIWPEETEVLLGFRDNSGRPIRLFGSRDEFIPLAGTVVRPRIFRDFSGEKRLKEAFGPGVIDLGTRTILSGRCDVAIRPSKDVAITAVGLITSTADTVPLPEGTELARVICRTADGLLYSSPVRLGIETADANLERWPSVVARHPPAAVFSSWTAVAKGREFTARDYQFVLKFGSPVRLEEIELNYDYPERGAWFVKHLFLIAE
ncbi:MAG: tetratricopeptide repeat protein [PVC group bacterium]